MRAAIVTEQTQADIAGVAEQRPYLAGRMVVIDVEAPALAAWLVYAADGAAAALGFEKSVIVARLHLATYP